MAHMVMLSISRPLPHMALLTVLLMAWNGPSVTSALAQQLEQPPVGSLEAAHAVLTNAVEAEPVVAWQGALNSSSSSSNNSSSSNSSLPTYSMDIEVSLPGAHLVPFTQTHQAVLVAAMREVLMLAGPAEFNAYREVLPDPLAPARLRDAAPSVEVHVTFWPILPAEYFFYNTTHEAWQVKSDFPSDDVLLLPALSQYTATIMRVGQDLDTDPRMMVGRLNPSTLPSSIILHTLLPLNVSLAVILEGSTGAQLSGEAASAVMLALEEAVVGARLGTLVEVADRARMDGGRPILELEVTLFNCRRNATTPTPECEIQILQAVLTQVAQSADVKEQWQAAGVQSVEVLHIGPRPSPVAPLAPPVQADELDYVPWHLDRLDQQELPLDGKFTATADGTGVHVYIISSGVFSIHDEFGYLSGAPGSRVVPEWGYMGLDPTEDCPQPLVYSYGTYIASLCCGLQLGAAKNASIHAVRFRELCLPAMANFGIGSLPAALDLVLSAHIKPAVALIDTWWGPGRQLGGDADGITAEVLRRLDRMQAAGIPVLAPAEGEDVCTDNVIAAHPGVIAVAATNNRDQTAAFSPHSGSCIGVWAPSGGLGSGLWGASGTGPSNYTRASSIGWGAAAVATGVAAQYLELHPTATAGELRGALTEKLSTRGVMGVGPSTTAALLGTNLKEPTAAAPEAATSGGSGGLSTGAIVGIAVAAAAGLLSATAGVAWYKRARRLSSTDSTGSSSHDEMAGDWEISPEDIEICHHPDGSEWLLGQGRFGHVYKALKGGVQVVAVKKLSLVTEELQTLFYKEAAMMKWVSRDPGVTQFYGACLVPQTKDLMLVMELMEGGDLRSALSSEHGSQLQWHCRGKDVMLSIVRGVHFLHTNRVTHRDVKTKNILLDALGRAKISDVGLATFTNDQDAVPTIGTLAWAAPELLTGGECTMKADIFSLGVILWELVTLEVPVRGMLRPPAVPAECPQSVVDAIQACMETDPAARPTARELHDLLLKCPAESESGGSDRLDRLPLLQRLATPLASSGSDRSGQSGSRPPDTVNLKGGSLDGASPIMIDLQRVQRCKHADGSDIILGRGAFGQVYKVLLDGVHPFAAKFIELRQSARVQSAFMREAGLLWQLRHQSVVALTGVAVSEEGEGYLLMELMEGGSLRHKLNLRMPSGQRVFSWSQRGHKVALSVAQALHFLHSFRIVHYDLSAGNVLLTRKLEAKLSDAGLARVLLSSHHSMNSDMMGVGTWHYMAPELLGGCRCTEAVDVYSYGILLHEICTGVHPIRGQMDARPLRAPEDCPQEVVDLYQACTATVPEDRPSARDIVDSLLALGQQKALAPAPPSAPAEAQAAPVLQPLGSTAAALPGRRASGSGVLHTFRLTSATPASPFAELSKEEPHAM